MIRFALLLVVLPAIALAQNRVRVTGYIKSASDKSAVPYATIKIKSQEVYTASNNDGYFEFNFTAESLTDSLLITSLGFTPKQVAVSGFRFQQEIFLDPTVVQIQEVQVLSGEPLTARQIVDSAIARIPRNYADSFRFEAYFRKYQQIDSTYISFLDASVEIADDQFTSEASRKPKEYVHVLAVRKSLSYNEKGYSNWADSIMQRSNWLERLLGTNDVRSRAGLLGRKTIFDTVGYTTFNGKLCYEIKVLKKQWHYVRPGSTWYKGYIRLIIDTDDYAIYRITEDEHSTNTSDKKQFPWGIRINSILMARIIGGTRILEFRKVSGKLILNYMSDAFQVEDFKKSTGATVHVNRYGWELFVNKVSGKGPADKQLRTAKERDLLKMSHGNYDPQFWASYNMPPFTAENYKTFRDLSRKIPIEEQFRKSAASK